MQLGKMVEPLNQSQPNPGLRADESPYTCRKAAIPTKHSSKKRLKGKPIRPMGCHCQIGIHPPVRQSFPEQEHRSPFPPSSPSPTPLRRVTRCEATGRQAGRQAGWQAHSRLTRSPTQSPPPPLSLLPRWMWWFIVKRRPLWPRQLRGIAYRQRKEGKVQQ